MLFCNLSIIFEKLTYAIESIIPCLDISAKCCICKNLKSMNNQKNLTDFKVF